MDFALISDVSAKFLTPDLVHRTRKMTKMEHVSHRISSHVEKVFNSKRECLTNFQKQYRQLKDMVQAKKQNRKALLLKRSEDYVKSGDIINKTKQLQFSKENLVKEEENILEEFGKTLFQIDQQFLQSVTNSTDDSVAQMLQNLRVEIETVREEIKHFPGNSIIDSAVNFSAFNQAIDEVIGDGAGITQNLQKISEEYEMLVEELEHDV